MCGVRESGRPILNDILWISQSTQVSWSRPADSDCSSGGQRLQRDHAWGTHCSKGIGTFMVSLHVLVFCHFMHQWGPWTARGAELAVQMVCCVAVTVPYEQVVGM